MKFRHSIGGFTIAVVLLVLYAGNGCRSFGGRRWVDRVFPTHDRFWSPEQAVLPYAEIYGSQYLLRNIRDCDYLSAEDFIVQHSDRMIELSQIQSVDFIVVPFSPDSPLAHTMVSFGLDDGSYLCVSVEVRREVGEQYRALAGLTNGYDLIYVLGEERDLIGVRANHYQVDVYVYPSNANPGQAQDFFADIIGRMNQLREQPEFYHLLHNNCTTNLKDHVNRLSPNRIRDNAWEVLLPGFSSQYAYRVGLIENRIPYEDLRQIVQINGLSGDVSDPLGFSRQIRSRRDQIDRHYEAQQKRTPLLEGRGSQQLANHTRGRVRRLSAGRPGLPAAGPARTWR